MIDEIRILIKNSDKIYRDLASLTSYVVEKLSLNTPEKREELAESVKIAWSYEEIHVKNFTLNEAVSWFKDNMPNNVSNGCILKMNVKLDNELHLCFMDGDEPLLRGNYPHLSVKTKTIGEGLSERFKTTDMIIVG